MCVIIFLGNCSCQLLNLTIFQFYGILNISGTRFACHNILTKGILPMKKSITYAKDQLLSRAIQLPRNLVIEANSSKGKFEIQFLTCLSNKQLKLLKTLSEEQKTPQVHLEFFSAPKESKECPKVFKNFSHFDWGNLAEIKIQRSQPIQTHADTPARYNVTVVLVTKS